MAKLQQTGTVMRMPTSAERTHKNQHVGRTKFRKCDDEHSEMNAVLYWRFICAIQITRWLLYSYQTWN